jgi:predicted cupin superfamily sugar epimerase
MLTAEELIIALGLQPLPREGGFFRETYRSTESLGDRSLATAIYYLLTPETFSALHCLPIDEVFHFYGGDCVSMLQLSPDGRGRVVTLGSDVAANQQPQVVVPAGTWQGSWLADGGRYALLGTTMAPGFDFADYRPGNRADIELQYPAFREIIRKLAPQPGDA